MRVLFVTYGLPYPPHSGARSRDYHLLREVARRHQVLLLSQLEFASEAAHAAPLRDLCAVVEAVPPLSRSVVGHVIAAGRWAAAGRPLAAYAYFSEATQARLACLLRDEPIDIVQIEHSFLAPYRAAIPMGAACRTILSLHNVGAAQYQSMRRLRGPLFDRVTAWLKSLLMRGWEARAAAAFDHTVVVSAADRAWLVAADLSLDLSVIPNGVDTVDCPFLVDTAAEPVLLFVGTMGYQPNVDAACVAAEAILPLVQRTVPAARLQIVGGHPAPRVQRLAERSHVTVTGYVPDLIPVYQAARICVVPLRAGGGTRLKILEAMAFGRPVVSTRIGCEGLDVVAGEHLLIADTPTEFAAQVVRLLNDADLWHRLRCNARRLVEQRYEWAVIGRQLLALYDRLAEPAGDRRRG